MMSESHGVQRMDQVRLRRSAKVFQALRALVRLRILEALAQGESNVVDLGHTLHVSQPLLSWHLKELRQVGLVQFRREGREVFYRLCPESFQEIVAELDTLLGKTVELQQPSSLVKGE